MRKTDLFNNVSDSLLEKTKLKKDEIVRYRIISTARHPLTGEFIIPSAVSIPATDEIWDQELQEFVNIAAIDRISPDGSVSFENIWFYGSDFGILTLAGGSAKAQNLHSYLALSNYNASNPNRNTQVEPFYELMDENAKSETERKTRNLKREALNIAADLSIDDVKTYIAALGKDDTRKVEVMRNELEMFADRFPKEFLELMDNKQATLKAVINRALNKNIITFDVEQSRFSWANGEVIVTVSRSTQGDNVEDLLTYLISSTKGEKILQTIQSKLKK